MHEEYDYKCNKNNLKIIDSYKITDEVEMYSILKGLLDITDLEYKPDRSIMQLVYEWKTHNLLYKLPFKYFKEHCKDCDFSINESKFRLFIYSILGRL